MNKDDFRSWTLERAWNNVDYLAAMARGDVMHNGAPVFYLPPVERERLLREVERDLNLASRL